MTVEIWCSNNLGKITCDLDAMTDERVSLFLCWKFNSKIRLDLRPSPSLSRMTGLYGNGVHALARTGERESGRQKRSMYCM